MLSVLARSSLVATALVGVFGVVGACSLANDPGEPVPPGPGTGGSISVTSSGQGGMGGDTSSVGGMGGDACGDGTAPTVTSAAVAPVLGAAFDYELTFDEEVTLEAIDIAGLAGGGGGGGGGAGGAGGAAPTTGSFTVSPSLPATSTSFTISIQGADPNESYELSVQPGDVADACGNELAAPFAVQFTNDCGNDATGPTVVSQLRSDNPPGTTMAQYVLDFSEPVLFPPGALQFLDGAPPSVTISPEPPAASDSFTMDFTLDAGVGFSLEGVTDLCGNPLEQDPVIEVCSGVNAGTTTFNYTGQVETFTVPPCTSGMFQIRAEGAEGGRFSTFDYLPGKGARAIGNFALATGDEVSIVVGQSPTNNNGGGGSFVADGANNPLVVAGGGGGSGRLYNSMGGDTSTFNKSGRTSSSGGTGGNGGGSGGTNGNGGNSVYAGAGGGFLTDGGSVTLAGGVSFTSLLMGAASGPAFGGGGQGSGSYAGGGGGGYSGGGGGPDYINVGGGPGGGGGSFNADANGTINGNFRSGNGIVVITY